MHYEALIETIATCSRTSLLSVHIHTTQVYLHLGLTHGAQHFSGVIFQFVDTSASSNITGVRKNRQSKITPLAIGGRSESCLIITLHDHIFL